MQKSINYFARVLCALLLCAGLAFASCTEGPLGDDPKTEQGGNQNNGSENGGDNSGGSQDKPTDENEVTSGPVTITIDNITATTVTFKGKIDVAEDDRDFSIVTVRYSEPETFSAMNEKLPSVSTTAFDENGDFTIVLDKLNYNTTYKYCVIAKVRTEETYSEKVMSFTTVDMSVNLSDASSTTATTAQITATVEGLSESDKSQIQVGMLYSSEEGKVENGQGTKLAASEISLDSAVSFSLSRLTFGTTYYYCSYVKQGTAYVYGEVKTFVTGNVSVSVSAKESTIVLAAPVAEFAGVVTGLFEEDKSDVEVGVACYTTSDGLKTNSSTKVPATSVISDGSFETSSEHLSTDTKYYYCSYVKQNGKYVYGAEIKELQTVHPYRVPSDLNVAAATDLSSSGSANCYIVSNAGLYKFKTVKGNSSESVGNVASASILWESFGTSITPDYLDLIKGVDYENGYIAFQTADTFREGNTVIAAKDASGTILWSWHIWLTDQPEGQVYYNNAGTMMDRNLGATSATPGDVGALGLLYQWGRKDPFLGSSSISSTTLAKSTITWPSAVSTSSSRGTVDYVTSNPTVFVYASSFPYDWHCSSRDNTLWTNSSSTKSIYDPCPAGWRVPDGGDNGVWSKALGSSSYFTGYPYDSTNEGMNFSGKFGSASTIWYPASGFRTNRAGSFSNFGDHGYYWSASPDGHYAYYLYFDDSGYSGHVDPSIHHGRAGGLSVRCLQESK